MPSCVEQVRRLLAIPVKKTDEALVTYLTRDELQALLDAPDPSTRDGVRDRAMLHLAFAAGLRVSELVGLRLDEVVLDPGVPTVRIRGKGRRERLLPLWRGTAAALRAWLSLRGPADCDEIFLSARGEPLTRAGFAYILAKHVAAGCRKHPALARKHVSPHVLRHTCAMHTLQATGDIRRVALWLGHASVETTEIYLRCAPSAKLEAIAGLVPPTLSAGRFRAPDQLLASLRPVPQRRRYVKSAAAARSCILPGGVPR